MGRRGIGAERKRIGKDRDRDGEDEGGERSGKRIEEG